MRGMLSQRADEIILTADWVLPISSPPIRRGCVRVLGERIVEVGTEMALSGSRPNEQRIDLGPSALLPGLVNAHTHLELTMFRGLFEDLDFFTWIRRLTAMKEKLSEADFLASARRGALEALRSGVTTVGDCASSGQVARAISEMGLRGIVFQEVFGPDVAQCEASMAGLRSALERQAPHAGSRVRLGVSPHAPYTVSERLFREVVGLALDRGLPVAVHAAESRAESTLIRHGTGPIADRLRERGIRWDAPGVSPIQYLARTGLLAARPLLIHAIDVDDRDLETIRETRSTIAHCPRSNAKLCHPVAPLLETLAARVRVGFGTDGAVSSNNCDLLEEARFAVLAQRSRRDGPLEGRESLDARAALKLLTLGGAEALGLEREIGTLEQGKRADLTAVDLSRLQHGPEATPEAAVVFSASAGDVVLTMVDGKLLWRRSAG